MAKILVVDDDMDMLSLIQIVLQKDGYQVDLESDAAVVQSARCRQYDLILLDVMMPVEYILICRQRLPAFWRTALH